MSRGERQRVQERVRLSMSAQVVQQGRYQGGRPPYGYTAVGYAPHSNPRKAAELKRLEVDPTAAPVAVLNGLRKTPSPDSLCQSTGIQISPDGFDKMMKQVAAKIETADREIRASHTGKPATEVAEHVGPEFASMGLNISEKAVLAWSSSGSPWS